MRRGELAGLRWGDWHESTHRLSIARSRQVVAGRSVEVAVKTRTSRRCIDLDADTEGVLRAWRRRQQLGELGCTPRGEPMPPAGKNEAGCSEVVVLAKHEVGSEVMS